MNIHPSAKRSLVYGSLLLGLGVLIGAFGAHGLKNIVDAKKLLTFETGVRYHFYHSFGILILGIIQQLFHTINLNTSFWAFLGGVLLFSFNCYLYALTGNSFFAVIVPIGGGLFIFGWIMLFKNSLKLR